MKMGKNLRGVMVIKQKDKSRASQRKGALANWKKTGKRVNRYLRKRKITGDDLRREMWINDEAETPKAARKKKGMGYDMLPGVPGMPQQMKVPKLPPAQPGMPGTVFSAVVRFHVIDVRFHHGSLEGLGVK